MISPHARGTVELMPFMAGRYLAVGLVIGFVAGAVVASVVWVAASWWGG